MIGTMKTGVHTPVFSTVVEKYGVDGLVRGGSPSRLTALAGALQWSTHR